MANEVMANEVMANEIMANEVMVTVLDGLCQAMARGRINRLSMIADIAAHLAAEHPI
jgi:hypothetical protein